ncbi:hypothetical protein FG877_02710 [Enterococcus casseliflavus]|nr:hypothetical protein [Enterococcus casseliflavus]
MTDKFLEEFLNTSNKVEVNSAEYSMFVSLDEFHREKVFLLQLDNLDSIGEIFQNIRNYIGKNYKSHSLSIFKVEAQKISVQYDESKAGNSYNEAQLHTIAVKQSITNNGYVLIKSENIFDLIFNGEPVENFQSRVVSHALREDINSSKLDIDQIEEAFQDFQYERKKRFIADYLEGNAIKKGIDEQYLRNKLRSYLKERIRGKVLTELCTSIFEDEESVDISIQDKNDRIAIIEVKYIFMNKYLGGNKTGYSMVRFNHGYQQLNRYCDTLINHNEEKIHSCYLYMFYAHDKTYDEIMQESKSRFIQEKPNFCEEFINCYRTTVADDLLERENQLIKLSGI